VVSLVPVLLVVLLQHNPVQDDPYIFFRYARNLAHGQGWRFNPGVPDANAITSPLYVLLLATATRLGISTTGAATALFVLTSAGAAFLTGAALRRFGFRIGALAVAALVGSAPALGAVRGMDASLYLFLVAASFLAALERRVLLTGLCFAAVVLTRPEGLVFTVAIAAAVLVADRSRRPTRKQSGLLALAFVTPLVCWFAFASLVVGHVIPSTFAAKIAQRQSGLFGHGWVFLRGARELWKNGRGSPDALRTFFYVLLGLAIVGLVSRLRDRNGWQLFVPLIAAGTALALFYGVMYNLPPYLWYYAPFVWIELVFAAVGVDALLHAIRSRSTRIGVAAFTVMALTTIGLIQTPRSNPVRDDYFPLAAWLRAHTPKSSTVMFTEIGTIGWASDRRIVDWLGLLDRAALPYLRKGQLGWWADYYRPDYWIHFAFGPTAANRVRAGHHWYVRVHKSGFLLVYRRIA
jgi:MFS family permease